MHGSAVGVQGLEAKSLRRSEQPMRSTCAQVQGPEAETLLRFILRITDPDGQRNERVVVE